MLLNFPALGGPGSLQANRDAVFERIRDPDAAQIAPSQMPSAYGDYYGPANNRGGETDPSYLHSVSRLQYALLRAWQKGDFDEDWGPLPAGPPVITPEALDRAALENGSGGAFFPGMEASWLLEKKEVWDKPFRLARGRKVGTVPVPGESQTGCGGRSRRSSRSKWPCHGRPISSTVLQADLSLIRRSMVDSVESDGGR